MNNQSQKWDIRRTLCGIVVAFAMATGVAFGPAQGAEATTSTMINDDGLYSQSWFLESFMELREDLAEATQEGKRFAILWEQKGCPYCKDLHVINFAEADINKYVRENFVILQLNMWGDREVTDFDGEVLSEKKLARKWGVVFTPTMHFFVEEKELVDGKPGSQQVASVMPGYFRPFHFISMFEYVKERDYDRLHFQKFISERVKRLKKEGKDTTL